MVSPVGTVTTDDPEEEEEVEVSAGGAVTDAAGLAKALWTLGRETGSQTATEQAATASASVSGVGSLTFTATTPSLVPLTDHGCLHLLRLSRRSLPRRQRHAASARRGRAGSCGCH